MARRRGRGWPDYACPYIDITGALAFLGRREEAREMLARSRALTPTDLPRSTQKPHFPRDDDRALQMKGPPPAVVAASRAFLGRMDKARATWRLTREKNPDRLAWFHERPPCDRPEEHAQRSEGPRLAAGEPVEQASR